MSYESTGIPLVVRYNTRGEPDGLKEELNIRVTSIEADTYLGGDLGISALSAVQDLQLSTPIQDGDSIVWSDGIKKWVNKQIEGGGGSPPGSIYFTSLEDTPGQYTVGSPATPPDAILRVDNSAPTTKITFSTKGDEDLLKSINVTDKLYALTADQTLVRTGTEENDFEAKDFKIRGLYDVNLSVTSSADDDKFLKIYWTGSDYQIVKSDYAETAFLLQNNLATYLNENIRLKNLEDVADYKSDPSPGSVLTWTANGVWEPGSPGTGVTTFALLSDTIANSAGSYISNYTNGVLYLSSNETNNYFIAMTDPIGPYPGGGGEPVLSVEDASEVVNKTKALTAEQVLIYDSSIASLTGVDFSLSSLADTNITLGNLSDKHVLRWDGATFSEQQANFLFLADTPGNYPADTGAFVVVNGNSDGLTFATQTTSIFDTLQGNIDTINDITIPAIYASSVTVSAGVAANAGSISDLSSDFAAINTAFGTISGIYQNASQGQILYKNGTGNFDFTGRYHTLENINNVNVKADLSLWHVIAWDGSEWANFGVDGLVRNPNKASDEDNKPALVIHASGLGASGFPQNNVLTVGPSGTITSISTAPLEGQEGKLRLINQSSTAETNSSALIWDYVSEGLQVIGDVSAQGTLTATSKSFLIDHPTKEGMKLQYTCLEGPENGVYVRGRCKTNVIVLPDYWVGLVDEESISVNLTPAGKPQSDLFVENIVDNKIFLQRSSNESIDCFYTVYATRKDIEKLIVEF